MRFLRKNKAKKTVIVISDLHLGAGAIFNQQLNFLEDFHYDRELVEFLEYFSSGEYTSKNVELIINGDFLDFLNVPYVEYFDDEFFSEPACLEKFEIIRKAHEEVFEALNRFISSKNRKITYILGNHDAEMVLPAVHEKFIECFDKENRERIFILLDSHANYSPLEGVIIKHGHEYEIPHDFDPKSSVVKNTDGVNYFVPPWGSHYVMRVINKYKRERGHVNAVRPIRVFLINGLIYDTLFTLRFIFGTCFYFIMVRFISFFLSGRSAREVLELFTKELVLFKDYEEMTRETILSDEKLKVLVVGHTHYPQLRTYYDGSVFINTGTWTRMSHLDFGRPGFDNQLPYAFIEQFEGRENKSEVSATLNIWKGTNNSPFEEFGF